MKHTKISTFQEASDYLGNKQERPYANNTRIQRVADNRIDAKYHGHTVASFYPNDNVYSSAGWKTSTTKERINWFLPRGFNLYQSKSVWAIVDLGENYERSYDERKSHTYLFEDGITINPATREVTGAGTEDGTQKTLKTLRTFVKNYVQALVDGKIGKPTAGDCWYCLMQTEDGQSLGDATGNSDHILSHFEEKYYVPSLLVNAFKFNHRISPMAQDGIARLQAGESISDWQKEIVSRDVKSCLTAYLKHCLNIAQ